jgi:antirestriction protein
MENPKIYVASLSDYNNGRLEGKWLDFADYSDASELMDAITDMLDELTTKYNDGEVREEWAVHDYEYIPSSLASEYMSESDFQEIYDIMEVADEQNIPMEVLMERVGDTGNDDYKNIAESLMFVVDGNDESDIVYEIEEQLGELGFDFWRNHIYIDDVTQRVMYSEDVDRYREDIEYDNPDLDSDEVERMAEERADDEERERNDDLIGYLEGMGYEDVPNWVSKDYESAWDSALSYDYNVINHDGIMYVFSNNYGHGGMLSHKKKTNYGKGGQTSMRFEDGGVAESMHFFIVNNNNDKNYNSVGYSIDETITDKQGNEFEKLYFENKKLPKKYNVNDLIYLRQRSDFTQKDRFGETSFVILVDYESSSKPYYYLYNVTKKFVATEGSIDWIKSSLPKGWKFYDSYGEGGDINQNQVQISDADLENIKRAVAEAQNENRGRFSPMGMQNTISTQDAMQFVKEHPEVLKILLLKKGGKIDSENYQMLKSKIKEVMHHAKELNSITNRKKEVPAWVVAKSTRASTDLSDITHYMDGANERKFAKGGMTEHGLEIGDEIMGYTKKVNELHVINRKNDEWHSVDLDDGKRYVNGGKVRKMELYDAVLYNGKQYDISKKNGVVGLKNLSQGAWGSDYPFIPLSKLDINDVTDMYGNKVEISEIYMNGGGVDGLSDLIKG